MIFLKREKSEITIIASLSQSDAAKAQQYLQIITSNLSLEHLALLSKAVQNPLIKMAAIEELKKHV